MWHLIFIGLKSVQCQIQNKIVFEFDNTIERTSYRNVFAFIFFAILWLFVVLQQIMLINGKICFSIFLSVMHFSSDFNTKSFVFLCKKRGNQRAENLVKPRFPRSFYPMTISSEKKSFLEDFGLIRYLKFLKQYESL